MQHEGEKLHNLPVKPRAWDRLSTCHLLPIWTSHFIVYEHNDAFCCKVR